MISQVPSSALCQTLCHEFTDCDYFNFFDGVCKLYRYLHNSLHVICRNEYFPQSAGDSRSGCKIIGGSPSQSVEVSKMILYWCWNLCNLAGLYSWWCSRRGMWRLHPRGMWLRRPGHGLFCTSGPNHKSNRARGSLSHVAGLSFSKERVHTIYPFIF